MAGEQNPDKTQAGVEPEEGTKKKGKFKIIVFIALFIIIAGAAGGYFFYGKKIMQKITGKQIEGAEGQGAGQKAAEKKREAIGPILSLEPFVFNMSGNQSKYAKVSVGLEFKDIKVEEEAKKMVPAIRDRILSIFATKTSEALMDVNQRNVIKGEIRTNLKTLFKDAEDLKTVYVTDIIIQ